MKLLLIICFAFLPASCKTKAKSIQGGTMALVDTLHLPSDSLAFYFPVNSFSDKPNVDSFVQAWYSSSLYSFKEPHLFKDFLGHSIYRFLWLRSFHMPVVFTLNKKDDQVWLNTKMLNRRPQFQDDRIGGVPKEDQDKYIKEGFFIETTEADLMVRIADSKADIIYNKNTSLSDKEWNEFEQILTKANYWKLPTKIYDGNTDGASWVIEAHLKDKYHLVDYHSPYNIEFAKAGLFLISLSGLKEELY